MSNLTLITGQWHDNINQVEKVEPILGGASGNANLATRQLAENILWLRQNMQSYKVGDIYTTTLDHANAAAVAAHHGYGTWERFAEGRTLVGFSTNAADPDNYKTMGNEFGANTHTLTVEESASHNHNDGTFDRLLTASGVNTASGSDSTPGHVSVHGGGGKIQPVGGNQPHNNIQPSIVAGCWLRTA